MRNRLGPYILKLFGRHGQSTEKELSCGERENARDWEVTGEVLCRLFCSVVMEQLLVKVIEIFDLISCHVR
jgi:hypothetical protein